SASTLLPYTTLFRSLLDALRAGLVDAGLDARSRGAFAVGLGLAQDEGSRGRLVSILADPKEDAELRGYSAVALGMVGDPSPELRSEEHTSELQSPDH